MTVRTQQLTLLAIAVSAALAACGGGGGDTPAATTSTTTTTTTTTTTIPVGGTTSGNTSNTTGTVTPGLPPAPVVPAANEIIEATPATTYVVGSESFRAYNILQDNRGKMRSNDFGIGQVTQSAALDSAAENYRTYLNGVGATATAAERAAKALELIGAGFPTSLTTSFDTTSNPGVNFGDFCTKAQFASVGGAELLSTGMRSVGLAVPADPGGNCVIMLGIADIQTWQLPPTGAAAVFPFPGKTETLRSYYGALPAVGGLTSAAGHPIYVSVASIDALPVNAAGGTAVASSQIVLNSFTLSVGGTAVDSVVLVPTGVNRSAVTNALDSSEFRYPTSMALVPRAKLAANTTYTVTLRATVKGRPVTVDTTFTTGAL